MKTKTLILTNAIVALIILLFAISCKKDDEENLIAEFTISTGEISGLNGNFAMASGKLRITSGKVTSYGHCWSKYPQPTVENDQKTDLGASGSTVEFFSELDGLEPGTFYYVRTYAKDNNSVTYGNEIPFMTPNILVGPSEIIDLSPDFVTLQAHITIFEGAVAKYGFCWSTHDNPSIYDEVTESMFLPSSGDFDETIENLQPKTKYYCRAYARAEQVVYGPVIELYIDNIMFTCNSLVQSSNTSAELTTEIDFKNSAIIQHGHCWSLNENPTLQDQHTEFGYMHNPGSFSSALEGLQQDTRYYFRAYVQTADTIMYSEEISYHMAFPLFIAEFAGGKRSMASSFTINGDIYLGFGESQYSTSRRDLWKYIPASDSWEQMASYPLSLNSGKAYAVSNNGYVFRLTYTDKVLGRRYDPESDSWPDIPELVLDYETYDIYSVSIHNRLFVSVANATTNELHLYEYKPNTENWEEKSGRVYNSTGEKFAFTVDGKAYWIFPYQFEDTPYFWEYDIENDLWSMKAAPPEAQDYGEAIYFSYHDKGYYQEKETVYVYDPGTDTWGQAADFSQPLENGISIQYNDNVYIGAGYLGNGDYTNQFYHYCPEY